jgi:hypothetical protein
MTGSIVGLFVSPNGGVPKFPHPEIVVQPSGCLDDKQNDTKHHAVLHELFVFFVKKSFTNFKKKVTQFMRAQLARIF